MEMFPTAKRTACDRCREQKLRCPRRQDSTQPCERCTRAGRTCVTGFTKRLGRGPRNVVQPTYPSGERARQIISPNAPSSTTEGSSVYELQRSQWPRTQTSSTFISPSRSSGGSLRSEWTRSTPNPDGTILSQHPLGPANASPDAGTGAGYAGVPHGLGNVGLDFWTQITPPPPSQAGMTAANTYNPSGPIPSLRIHDSRNPPRHAPGMSSGSNPSDPSHAFHVKDVHHGMRSAESDRQLSELGADLCKQISDQDRLQSLCSEGDTRSAVARQQIHDAIGNALASNSRFIAVLQAYPRDNGAGQGSQPIDSEREVVDLTLQLTCSLNAVTTYLRLIVLFDKLLFALCHIVRADQQALTSPYSGEVREAQLLPGLQLAGFPISQSGFQAKILVEAITHQFETMEMMLAVPLEMRVSDRQSAYTGGIFSQKLDEHLLKSLLSTQFNMDVSGGESTPAAQRIAPLVSLRKSVDKIQELARIT